MNLYPVTAFLRHLLTARSAAGYGVHSPFVFDFLANVLRGTKDPFIIGEVERLRREMLADRRNVSVTDLGAGPAGRTAKVTDLGAGSAPDTVRVAGSVTGAARRTVSVTDLGAGPAKRVGEERSISAIAATSALPAREVALLARIAQLALLRAQAGGTERVKSVIGTGLTWSEAVQFTKAEEHRQHQWPTDQQPLSGRTHNSGLRVHRAPDDQDMQSGKAQSTGHNPASTLKEMTSDKGIILELGTSLGISTLALALGAPESRVVTVEGCPVLAETAAQNLLRHGASNAEVLNAEFSTALEMLKTSTTTVSLAFIDGNHRGPALLHYAETIRSMGEEMIIVADDIHLNRGMYSAWQALTKSGIAAATLETFRVGILFCLPNLTPGRYRIRY